MIQRVRVARVTLVRHAGKTREITVILAREETPPEAPPTLGAMIRLVTGYGGFLGRKGDDNPGPKALWEDLMKLTAYVEALQSVHVVYGFTSICGYLIGCPQGLGSKAGIRTVPREGTPWLWAKGQPPG